MRHLSADELIDAAERRHNAPSGHLAECERCQERVDELRDAIAAAAAVEVPEPSPLFWEHFSARVHDAIAREPQPRRVWPWTGAMRRVRPAILAGALAVVVAFIGGTRLFGPHATAPATRVRVAAPIADPAADVDVSGDPSLAVVADLMSEADAAVDPDTPATPLVIRADATDHAVTMLTDEERAELQRLLKQELERPGA